MKKFYLLLTVLAMTLTTVMAQTITTGTIASPICAGATINIPYQISGTFTAGNRFVAQLSNSAGAFTTPVLLDSLTNTVGGIITAKIPSGTAAGTAYKIRVISRTPAITGTANATALTISTIPTISIASSVTQIINQVITYAGSGIVGSADGTGSAASFNSPFGVAVDATGNVYVADLSSNKIRKITPAGVVSTLAGSGVAGSADGTGSAASFNNPYGVAVDAAGNVYVTDQTNQKIRKITPAGVVSTLAGSGELGSVDGTGSAASFYNPTGVAVDAAGNVYVADLTSNKIRKITPAGVVSTLAGSGVYVSADGTGSGASFKGPAGVAVDATGNLYVTDRYSNKIRKITPAGVVSTMVGSGVAGNADGSGSAASFNYPTGVAVDAAGNVYVADVNNQKIRKIIPQVTICSGSALTLTATGGSTYSWSGPQAITNGTSFNATASGLYTVTGNNTSGCNSTQNIYVTIYSTPTAPVTTGASLCGTGTATITAIVPSGYTVDWYSAATAGTLLLSNSLSYTTPSITATTTYYAQAKPSAACSTLVSATRTPTTVTINPISLPATPTLAVGAARCGAGLITISATPASGATLSWYNAATGGTLLGSGTSFTLTNISTNTTYYAASLISATGCTSTSRLAVTATVNGIPDVSAGVQVKNSGLTGLINYPLCSGTGTEKLSITVPAVTPASTLSYQWYKGNPTGTNYALATLAPYSTQTTAALTITNPKDTITGDFYVLVKTAAGCSATSAIKTLTVKPLPLVSISSSANVGQLCTLSSSLPTTLTANLVSTFNATPTYLWTQSNVSLAITTPTYTRSAAWVAGAYYMCRVTTAVGDSATCAVPAIAQCDTIRPLLENTTNKWIAKASFSGLGRTGAVAFTVGERAYIGLGGSLNPNKTVSNVYKDLWEYNPDNNSWTQKADYPGSGGFLATSLSFGNGGIVCGGSNNIGSVKNDCYVYYPSGNYWIQKASMPVVNEAGAGFSDGSYLGYIVCPGPGNNNATNFTYQYDYGQDIWTPKTSFPGGTTYRPMSFNIGNRYFVGNSTGNFWEYKNTTDTWVVRSQVTNPTNYFPDGSSSFSIGDTAYIASATDLFSYVGSTNLWSYRAQPTIYNSASTTYSLIGYPTAFSIANKGYLGLGFDIASTNKTVLRDFFEYSPNGFSIRTGTISNAVSGTSYCGGSTINVPYTFGCTSTAFTAGNVFKAQLSDEYGNFSNPIEIGSLTGTTAGTITATLPKILLSSQNYRVRVISTSPQVIGYTSNYFLIINLSTPGTIGNSHTVPYPWELTTDGISSITEASSPIPFVYSWERTTKYLPDAQNNFTIPDTALTSTTALWSPVSGISTSAFNLTKPNSIIIDSFYRRKAYYAGCGVSTYSNVVAIKVASRVGIGNGRKNGTIKGNVFVATNQSVGVPNVTISMKRTSAVKGGVTNKIFTITTDQNGGYYIDSLFYGDINNGDTAATFEITPSLTEGTTVHQFSVQGTTTTPPSIKVKLSSTSPSTENPNSYYNFIDNTTFSITGAVKQTCSVCSPIVTDSVSNVKMTLTSTSAGFTPQTNTTGTGASGGQPYGQYGFSVTNPATYTITPSYKGHQYSSSSISNLVNQNLNFQDFTDTSTRVISGIFCASNEVQDASGKVRKQYIGTGTLTFTDFVEGRDSKFTKVVTINAPTPTPGDSATYSVRLPARKYKVSFTSFVPSITNTAADYIVPADLLSFFNTNILANKIIDIDSTNATLDLFYHRKPTITFDNLNDTCGTTAATSYVSFESGKTKTFTARIWEGPKTLSTNAGGTTAGFSVATDYVNPCSSNPVSFSVVASNPASNATNGSILARVNGGSPSNYLYSKDGVNYVTDSLFNLLGAGNYIIYVKNTTGCVASQVVALSTICTPINVNYTVVNPTPGRNDGQIIISAPDKNSYQFSVNYGATYASTGTDTIKNLSLGTYTLIAKSTSSAGCLGVTQVPMVSANPLPLKMSSAIQTKTTATIDSFYYLNGGASSISLKGGYPNTISPYLKNLSFSYTDRYGRSVDTSKRALVTGDKVIDGSFITTTPQIPVMILHQPPGNTSVATWSQTKSTSTAMSFSVAKNKSTDFFEEVKVGVDITTGLGVETESSVWLTAGIGVNTSATRNESNEVVLTNTTNTSYYTDPAGGDRFVGAALNLQIANTERLKYSPGCILKKDSSIAVAPKGYTSEYSYSELGIRNVVMPALQAVVNDLTVPQHQRDTALVSLNAWQQILDYNDANKDRARFLGNSSVIGNASSNTSVAKEETNTIDVSVESSSLLAVSAGFDIGGSGISYAGSLELRISLGDSRSTTTATETTTGYTISDNNPTDQFSVDIKKDPVYGTYVFKTVGGQSSCPTEPNTLPFNSAQLYVPDVNADGSANRVQNNIPIVGNTLGYCNPAIFNLQLGNTSVSTTTPTSNTYMIRVDANSIGASGALVAIGGTTLNGGSIISYTINRGSSQTIAVTVAKLIASRIYSLSNIKFEIWDDCLTEILDTAVITANFVNPCATNISLTSPNNNFVVNSASNNTLPISFTGYNTSSLSSVTIQYSKSGTSSWIDNMVLYPGNQIVSGSTSTTYNWNVLGLGDSAYDVRLKLLCSSGGEVYSNLVSGKIDRKAPLLLGTPKPSDGNYINGDEISFSYNENIDNSNLNTNTISMFKVVGNTSTSIAVSVSGYQNKIVIVPTGILVPGDIVRVVATNVRDIYGNTSTIKDTLNFIVGTSVAGTSRTITIANTLLNGSPKRAIFESGGDNMQVVFTMGNIATTNTTPTTVRFAVGGTAVYGSDYTVTNASFNNSQGTISIPNGSNSATLTINPIADGAVEPDESIIITLLSGADYTLGAASAITLYDTIKNDNLASPVITPTGTACNRILTTASTIGGQAVTAYQWKLVGSTAILSTTASYTATVAGSYTVTVFVGSQFGTSAAYVYTRPAATSSTTNTTVCSTPYSWNGQSLSSAGTYTATLVNAAGCDSIATLVLTVSSTIPAAPSTITQLLLDNTCGARVYRYTATAVTGATAYTWILPTSIGGVSGVVVDSGDVNTSRIIRLKYASNLAAIIGDTIRVNAIQGSCPGAFKPIKLTNAALSIPTPSAINGTPTACIGNIVTYTVIAGTVTTTSQVAASVYRWTIPANTVITASPADSSSITLQFNTGYVGGSITCKGQIACGIQSVAKTLSMQYVTPTPTAIASSTGLYNACIGTPITFTATVAAPSATQVAASVYRWTIPANTVITSATPVGTGVGDSLSVTVQFNTGYTGGNITVKGQTACYAGTAKSQALTHTGCPVGTTPPLITKVGNETIKFDASIQPNPTTSSFNLQVISSIISNSVKAKIMDVQGRLIKTLTFASEGKVNFGNELNPGVYMIEVREGDRVKTLRVVKY